MYIQRIRFPLSSPCIFGFLWIWCRQWQYHVRPCQGASGSSQSDRCDRWWSLQLSWEGPGHPHSSPGAAGDPRTMGAAARHVTVADDLLESHGISWNLMESHGISWIHSPCQWAKLNELCFIIWFPPESFHNLCQLFLLNHSTPYRTPDA